MNEDEKFARWVRESWGGHRLTESEARRFDAEVLAKATAGSGLGLWQTTVGALGAFAVLLGVFGASYPVEPAGTPNALARGATDIGVDDAGWWEPDEDGYEVVTIAGLVGTSADGAFYDSVEQGLDAASALAWIDTSDPYDEIVDVLPREYAALSSLVLESTRSTKTIQEEMKQ